MDSWEHLVWSAKDVNQRKANHLPHEAGLKLLRNAHGVAAWKLFLNE